MRKECCAPAGEPAQADAPEAGEYVCYCSKVSERDIASAIRDLHPGSVEEVIRITGAMQNSNCAVNNPKGTCCYSDIVRIFRKYSGRNDSEA